MRSSSCLVVWLAIALGFGCGDDGAPVDGGVDGSTRDAGAPSDAGTADAAMLEDGGTDASVTSDAGPSCLDEGHAAGDRFPAGDGCNFCECLADGTRACTERACPPSRNGCTYDGAAHDYAERFPSTDGCNECVCAPSGLACTRRECKGAIEEGAILVESLDEPCGDDTTFTAQAVLSGLPHSEITAPFVYDHDRPAIHYPETLPDTTVTMRITYDDGFAVCRIPAPGQEAFDIEVLVEWITADGAFDEGFHTYLRRNASGFVDAWTVAGNREVGELSGTYDPNCLDPAGFSFAAELDADGSAGGAVHKTCETDLGLVVGSWELTP